MAPAQARDWALAQGPAPELALAQGRAGRRRSATTARPGGPV